jgi:peptide/nickel transport system permease protein
MAAFSPIAQAWRRAADSELMASLLSSPVTVAAVIVTALIFAAALVAPLIAIQNPFDPASLNLSDSMKPPLLWGGERGFPLGTDDQGRDMYSAILYGTRLSLFVGFVSVLLAMALGTAIGLISGYAGGALDAFLMRVADIQLTFPAFLIALTLDGVVRGFISSKEHEAVALYVIVGALALSFWPQFARTVRSAVLVERTKDYVAAARIIGRPTWVILLRHILPNAMGPLLVIASINLGIAIVGEATLSFLGVGLPPTQPSLGTLIRIGNDYLSSGDLWITIEPGIALAVLVVAVNLVGDWLRDALNPKLR